MARLHRHRVWWLLALSQVALIGSLAVCVALQPAVVLSADEGGVSNYGVRAGTVVPYTVGLSLCALFLWLAARAVPASLPHRRGVVSGLEGTAGAFVMVLVSTYPYKVDRALDDLHLVLAVALFVIESVFVTWMAFVPCPSWRQAGFWLVWFAGFVLGGVTLAGLVHLLFLAQVMLTVGFSAVILAVSGRLLDLYGAQQAFP